MQAWQGERAASWEQGQAGDFTGVPTVQSNRALCLDGPVPGLTLCLKYKPDIFILDLTVYVAGPGQV